MFRGKKIKIKTYFILFLCFQKKINPPPHRHWLVALLHCNPPAPTEQPSCTTAPAWGRGNCSVSRNKKYFKKIKKFLKYCNPPPPPVTKPLCTTAPPWGHRDWNTTKPPTKFILFYFIFLETFQSLLKHGASCRCHPRSREIRLSTAERR
jgi:hypothetical protein